MPPSGKDLGRSIAVYGPAPAFLQRAVFLTVLSFLFFVGTMFIYYIRQGFVYFILASAFLVLYVISLISFVAQRKNTLVIHQQGIEIKKDKILWTDIKCVSDEGVILLIDQRTITIPKSLANFNDLVDQIRSMPQR